MTPFRGVIKSLCYVQMKKQVNSLISWLRALKKMRGKPKKSHKSYRMVQEDSRKKRRNHLVLVFGFFEVINLCLVPSGVWVVVAFTYRVLGNRRRGPDASRLYPDKDNTVFHLDAPADSLVSHAWGPRTISCRIQNQTSYIISRALVLFGFS